MAFPTACLGNFALLLGVAGLLTDTRFLAGLADFVVDFLTDTRFLAGLAVFIVAISASPLWFDF